MSKGRKLFYYSVGGHKQREVSGITALISTVALPPFSRAHEGICANIYYHFFPKNATIGTNFDLAYGDPRILMGCKLVSVGISELPEHIKKLIKDSKGWELKNTLTFKYRGGTVYVDRLWMCRLEDLE